MIEPAFGTRPFGTSSIITSKIEKEGNYTFFLNQEIAPFDVSVLPLFDKDGMGEMARGIATRIREIKGIVVDIDSSRSIGRKGVMRLSPMGLDSRPYFLGRRKRYRP